jgi:catechol 2,3-dioxygenase-like lactoylglutathione lyase family enzyme
VIAAGPPTHRRTGGGWHNEPVALTWFSTVVDCRDPQALAGFWCQVLGYQVVYQNEREVDIAPGPSSFPGLAFLRVPGDKQVKNRPHLDLNPGSPAGQAAEVERLEALGATRIDIGQGDAEWIVIADPEGNEFCVLAHQAGW